MRGLTPLDPLSNVSKSDMVAVKLIRRLRTYVFTIAGLVVILIAFGLFVADHTGVYQLSNGLPVWGLVLLGLICIVADIMKRHLYVGVGAAILLALGVGFVIGGLIAEPTEWPPRSVSFTEYCLFTWEDRSGNVCFKLMYNFEASRTIHSWTSKWGGRCGTSELKKALNALPEGSYVFWYDWPSKFDYPPSLDTDELIEMAKGKGVKLQLSPALQ